MAAYGGAGRDDTLENVRFITDVDETLTALTEAGTQFSENLSKALAYLQEQFKETGLGVKHHLFTSRDLRNSIERADQIRRIEGAEHLSENLFFLSNLLAHLKSKAFDLDFDEEAPIIQTADGLSKSTLGHGYTEHQTLVEARINAILAELDLYYESLPSESKTTMREFYDDVIGISEATYKPGKSKVSQPTLPLYLQLAYQHLDNMHAHTAETDRSIMYGDKRFMLAKLFAKYGTNLCLIWTDDCKEWYLNALNETKLHVSVDGEMLPLGSLVARCVVFVHYNKFNCEPGEYYHALKRAFFTESKPTLFPALAKIIQALNNDPRTALTFDPTVAAILDEFDLKESSGTPVDPAAVAKILAEAIIDSDASTDHHPAAPAHGSASVTPIISPAAATATPVLQTLSTAQNTPSTAKSDDATEVSDDDTSVGKADSDDEGCFGPMEGIGTGKR